MSPSLLFVVGDVLKSNRETKERGKEGGKTEEEMGMMVVPVFQSLLRISCLRRGGGEGGGGGRRRKERER